MRNALQTSHPQSGRIYLIRTDQPNIIRNKDYFAELYVSFPEISLYYYYTERRTACELQLYQSNQNVRCRIDTVYPAVPIINLMLRITTN